MWAYGSLRPRPPLWAQGSLPSASAFCAHPVGVRRTGSIGACGTVPALLKPCRSPPYRPHGGLLQHCARLVEARAQPAVPRATRCASCHPAVPPATCCAPGCAPCNPLCPIRPRLHPSTPPPAPFDPPLQPPVPPSTPPANTIVGARLVCMLAASRTNHTTHAHVLAAPLARTHDALAVTRTCMHTHKTNRQQQAVEQAARLPSRVVAVGRTRKRSLLPSLLSCVCV